MGWTNPWVLAGLIGGVVVLAVFCVDRDPGRRADVPAVAVPHPRVHRRQRRHACWARIARGGLQFMLIIWLQGIWLPLHGYDYDDTPLWAGIYLLPLTVGFLVAGPISGALSDRYGARLLRDRRHARDRPLTFVGLLLLPIDFSYWVFALLIFLNGLGGGLFSAPNTSTDHDQRAGRAARRRLRHARHLPERRHGALHRHLLLADDRRASPARCRARSLAA